jgi:uncharacterized protein
VVWAAAAVPMGLLAWVVAPWLADRVGGDEPLTAALLIVLTAGLIWQFVLVLILLRRASSSLPCGRWCPRSQVSPPEISAISSARTMARLSSAAPGAGSRSSSCLSSSTPCAAESSSSWGRCCRACELYSASGTGSLPGAVHTYHLRVPWVMPASLVEGIFLDAYPSRRFQSAWMGIIVHSVRASS